jgi:hypothetical protein
MMGRMLLTHKHINNLEMYLGIGEGKFFVEFTV